MKKILFLLAFSMMLTPLMAQYNYMTVQGTILDIATGLPVAGHPVHIQTDSINPGGFFYFGTVYTSPNGFYVDTIPLNAGPVPSGLLLVYTYDCQQYQHSMTFSFSPGNQFFTADFTICSLPSNCNADFTYQITPNSLNVQFFDQSTGGNVSRFWDFGDGGSSNLLNPDHTYAQPGFYPVTLMINDSSSSCWDSETKFVQVGDSTVGNCQADFTWYTDPSNNDPNTIAFVDLSFGGGATWFWSFGDSTFSTEQNPVHTYAQTGTYNVCLTITGLNPACQSTWCNLVTVGWNAGCESSFLYYSNGLNVAFDGYMLNGLVASAYSWSFGDGSSGSGSSVTHTYAAPGLYAVTLTTAFNNCTYTSTQAVIVGDSVQNNFLNGQVFKGNSLLSSGIAMIFSVDSVNTLPYNDISLIDSMGYYSFANVPNGNFVIWVIPTDQSDYLPTYYGDVLFWQDATVISLGQPLNPYNINLIAASDAPSGPGTINGHVNNGLKNGLDDKMRMILSNEEGSPLGFANVTSTGDFDFQALGIGIYFLRAELPGMTSDVIRIEITTENPVVTVNMTYSGNHLLGVSETESLIEATLIYPNPFKEFINVIVAGKREMNAVVTLTDLNGRNLVEFSTRLSQGNNDLKLETHSVQSGIYFLRIKGEEGSCITQKLVKTN